VSLEW